MDHAEIGNAMIAMASVLSISSRRTGRTTRLLESMKDGDCVVVANPQQRSRILEAARERGLKIEVRDIPVGRVNDVLSRGPLARRTRFDHSWVEAFYQHELRRLANNIDSFEEILSYGKNSEKRECPCAEFEDLKDGELGSRCKACGLTIPF